MAEPIKFTDLIKPDDTINELIQQLRDAKDAYEKLAKSVKAESGDIAKALHSTSGATEEGKQKILELAAASDRLASAEKVVAAAIEGLSRSEKGIAAAQKEVASATANTVDNMEELRKELEKAKREAAENTKRLEENARAQRESAEATERHTRARKKEAEEIEYAADSYKALKKELKELDKLFKTLSQVDRIDPELGGELAKEIVDLKKALKDADAALTPFVSGLYELARAKNKLAFARSEENRELKLYTSQIREANRVAELEVAIANSAEGSYNRLSAQYALNKIRLNQMGEADEEAVRAKRALELETKALYQQMIKLQEATGNHTLSVGNYKKVWNGLGMSVNQIVRELPAAAISLNTFFLGISNNVPILMDEIKKVRDLNAKLRAEGKQTKSVIGEVTRALFSWNTVMVLLLTVFAMHGEAIINWITNLFRGEARVLSLTERLKGLNEELKNSSKSYGSNYVQFKKLADEWKALTSEKEKLQWIEDNRSEFNRLELAIKTVNDADKAFIINTAQVLAAMKLRARATAAESLAAEKYAEELTKREEARQARLKVKELQKAGGTLPSAVGSSVTGYVQMGGPGMTEAGLTEKATALDKVADAAKETADAYYDMAAADNAAADAALKSIGLFGKANKGSRGPQPKDTEDTIESLSLSATKAYQDSITKLERDEIKKRRKEYLEAYNTEVADLARKYNKIQRILDGQDSRYKKLTEEQKEQALKAQDDIVRAIENKQKAVEQNLALLTYQQQEQDAQTQLEALNLQIEAVKSGSEEELRLRLQILRVEEQIALARNRQLPPAQQQDENVIKASFKKQRADVITGFNDTSFEQSQALEKAKFDSVKHNEQQITQFTLQQEKERWERQIQLAEAGALDWSQAQIDTAKETVKGINEQLEENQNFIARVGERGLKGALFESFGWNDDQIDAMSQATDFIVNQFSEILAAEVALAEKEKELADERVARAQSAYEAEVEARNNGYANNVATAKKELEQEKKNQLQKQKMLEAAQKRQQAVDTIAQTSSLITASALLWKSFAGTGPAAPFLAAAAIAAMWTSFAVAKIKARQVTSAGSEEYGEGGLEFLEGGSHASGNDIDLGVNNKRRRRMRAEGGEALAIINRRRTRQYRKVLPDVIESFNKGTFEDKYLNAFAGADRANISIVSNSSTDLSKLERDVSSIRKQNETKYFTMPDGTVIMQYKNVKRIIKN